MKEDVVCRLKAFIEDEARSCSMDFGCVTPEYVYRMWGGSIALEDIEAQVIEQIPKDVLYDFCCSYAQEHPNKAFRRLFERIGLIK